MNNDKEEIKKGNEDTSENLDQIGENTGQDTEMNNEAEPGKEDKEKSESSNKGQGPAGENL